MKKRLTILIGLILVGIVIGGITLTRSKDQETPPIKLSGETIQLPPPAQQSDISVEQALIKRRSVREYRDEALDISEISQLLWAAQGITHPDGYRTAPSAGALYPLEVYLLAGNVAGLQPGIYHYLPHEHALRLVVEGDQQETLCQAAIGQAAVREAAAVIIITAVYDRTTGKYGERGIRYVHIEVGSAAQNVYLQAVSLDLGTVFIGAFHDDEVRNILQLGDDEHPLCIMPVGKK